MDDRASGSLAVQVALEEIGVPFETHLDREGAAGDCKVSRDQSDRQSFLPLALPDGTLMFESAAILVHLSLVLSRGRPGSAAGHERTTRCSCNG